MLASLSPTDDLATSWRTRAALVMAGVGLAYHGFFAATSFSHVFKTEYGAMLALVAGVLAGSDFWRALWGVPFFRCTVAFAAYGVAQSAWVAARVAGAPSFDHQLSALGDPLRVGVFASVLGVWLATQPRWMPRVLALMLAGFLLMLCLYGNEAIGLLSRGELLLRLRLTYSENIGGLFAAELMVIVLAYALHILGEPAAHPVMRARWRLLMLLLLWVLLAGVLLLAQSRGAWLAALVGCAVTAWGLRHKRKAPRFSRKRKLVFLAVGLVVCGVLAWTLGRVVMSRLLGGDEVLVPLLHDGIDAVPNTSVGLRLHLYSLGVRIFLDHPFAGIGLRSVYPAIAASGIREGNYIPPHLHDSYLEVLVGLGLLGAALLAYGLFVLCRDAVRGYRAGRFAHTWFWLAAGWLAVFLIDNATDGHIWRFDYLRSTLELLLAIAIAFTYRRPGLGTPSR